MGLWDDEDIPAIQVVWERELWVADPGPFTPICFDMGVSNFVFRGKWLDMANVRQDFRKFIDMYARGRPWRVLYVPYPDREAVLFTSQHGFIRPAAVWPIWNCSTDSMKSLRRLWDEEQVAGTYVAKLGNQGLESVNGQEHRVICSAMPASAQEWATVAVQLQTLQSEYPDRTIHTHGQKSVGRTIGIGIKSFDHPVRLGWNDGFPQVLLPNGMTWTTSKATSRTMEHWLKVVGADPREVTRALGGDRKALSELVYSINLRSLRWAFLNWDRAWDFRRQSAEAEDLESADLDFDPHTLPVRLHRAKGERGLLDKWLCNTCSLQFKCPYSREGAVCIVPDSEPIELAKQFGTRNSDAILNGLSNILATNSHRANQALAAEQERATTVDANGNMPGFKLDSALTRLLNTLFDRGVQMAKLVDPRIAAQLGTKVHVNLLALNGGVGGGADLTPQMLMSGIASELEARGIKLEDATPEMINQILQESTGSTPAAIEATATEIA